MASFFVPSGAARTIFKPLNVIVAICAICATSATAQGNIAPQTDGLLTVQFVDDDGAAERIDYSGKLRMLSQRIVAASCYLQAGIQSDSSRAVLHSASAEFAQITDALEFGNADMGVLGAEERRRTLVGIQKLRALWKPIEAKAAQVEAGQGTPDAITAIAEQSAPLLDIAKRLVVEITGQYSGQTSVLQTDAFAIDIAGRQRMLAQRISKNVCLIASGINVQASRAELAQAAQNFEAALYALRGGSVEVGIRTPPTQEIGDGLQLVVDDWVRVKPMITRVIAGDALDEEGLGIMFETGNLLTGNMNKVVGLYAGASKMDT